MISKIKTRMASEEGFTLIELLVVIIILGILVAIAVPAYLSFAGKAKNAAAESNVRSAIPAAEAFYQDDTCQAALTCVGHVANTYDTLSSTTLALEAPGISPHVTASEGGTDQVYCIQDDESSTVVYHYEGGSGGPATILPGACPGAYSPS